MMKATPRTDYNGKMKWSKEKRKAELNLLAEMLHREQNRMAGAKTYSMAEIDADMAALLHED